MTVPGPRELGTAAPGDGAPRLDLLVPPGLGGRPDRSALGTRTSADTLRDLALDGFVDRLAALTGESLRAILVTPLRTVDAVRFRQHVFEDLDDEGTRSTVEAFVEVMGTASGYRTHQSRAHHPVEADLWGARAVGEYVRAVDRLANDLPASLASAPARSLALRSLAQFADAYAASDGFGALRAHATRVEAGLAQVRYAVLVRGPKVTVAPLGDEPDLQAQVLAAFDRFRQRDPAAAAHAPAPGPNLDHVQAQLLGLVAHLFEPLFRDVASLAGAAGVPDATLASAAEQLRFYLAWRAALAPADAVGLQTCLPEVVAGDVELHAEETWDLTLGLEHAADGRRVVTNQLDLHGDERVLVVSGPNQGGKTTLARTFGQLHLLAALGVPVPGRDVKVMLADRVLTVFDREEVAGELGGRLGAELARVHAVLDALTPASAVVLNEVFSSTALADARWLARRVLERLIAAGVPTMLVTFIDELSRLGPATVSMVAEVDPRDPTVRTWRVLRRRADGRAYADALADRYGLSDERLAQRLAR